MQASYGRIPSSLNTGEGGGSYEKLNERITTRVLALKILKQKEQENIMQEREKSFFAFGRRSSSLTENSRPASKFLSGASIPNSIIKAEMLAATKLEQTEDKNVLREKRDESVREIVMRMESRMSDYKQTGIGSETIEKNLSSEKLPAKHSVRRRTSGTAKQLPTIKEQIDPLKEQQRISRRTQVLAPLSCHRRPTYESIRRAIQNSKTCQDIVDVDSVNTNRSGKFDLEDSAFVSRLPSLAKVSSLSKNSATSAHKFESQLNVNVTSKASKLSKKSTGSSLNSKKSKLHGKKRKSILRRGSRDATKPLRTVSIVENTKEDSQTQTYLRMKDFVFRLRPDTNIDAS